MRLYVTSKSRRTPMGNDGKVKNFQLCARRRVRLVPKAHQTLSSRIYVGTQNLFINFMHELCKYGMRVLKRMCIA